MFTSAIRKVIFRDFDYSHFWGFLQTAQVHTALWFSGWNCLVDERVQKGSWVYSRVTKSTVTQITQI